MNFPIKTNLIKYDIDYNAIDNKYDIFMVSTTEKYFQSGARILDEPFLENNVCAIRFTYGKSFWVLMNANADNLRNLSTAIEKTEDAEKITITKQPSEEVYIYVLLQLLLNAMGTSESKFLKFNNLTGRLYCFHPKWLKHTRRNSETTIMKVPCLEISVSSSCRLLLNVRTFTNVLLRKKISFGKKAFNEYPQYIMTGKNMLRRKLNDDNGGNFFIMRQTQNDRTEIPFMDIKDIDVFSESKMGVMADIISGFNEKYQGLASIGLQDINEYTALDYTAATASENKEIISALLNTHKIKIVDTIADEYSKTFCNEIAELIKIKYNVTVSIGNRISKEYYNIRVIHNKEYYGNGKDPHNDKFTACSVQHITLEDFYDCREAAVKTVIHELAIKQNLIDKQISLFNWKSLNYSSDWTFGISYDEERTKRFFFMKVHPDGSFDISEQKLNLFEMNEYSNLVDIFEEKSRNNEQVLGIIKNGSGKINIIRDTGWYTVPEIEVIHQELSNGNTYLRNKEKKTQLLSACLDVRYFSDSEKFYYFVGTKGYGMQTKIKSSCNIRSITAFEDAPIFFDSLLPLMNVTFVRNGQLTILPFPFKYLREYVNIFIKSNAASK